MANAQQRVEADKASFTPESYCELIRHPKQYDGKNVAVWTSYRYGFEWQEIFCLKCRDQGKTWLEFAIEPTSPVRRALAKAPQHQGTLKATFYGIFRGSGGPYGDGGYAFRFDLKSVKAVEVVSKSGWAPEHLSPRERQKLCLGGERESAAVEKQQ